MTVPRFLQIHTLSPYTGVLLNRDDTGLAKRLPYGGVLRTRVSSQCLKRHWRIADDPHALRRIDGAPDAFRSRELVTHKVIEPLRGHFFGRCDRCAGTGISTSGVWRQGNVEEEPTNAVVRSARTQVAGGRSRTIGRAGQRRCSFGRGSREGLEKCVSRQHQGVTRYC